VTTPWHAPIHERHQQRLQRTRNNPTDSEQCPRCHVTSAYSMVFYRRV
jgi:hypothetical protein